MTDIPITQTIRIDDIEVPPRLRSLKEAKVAEIMDSIPRIGLRTPIDVRRQDDPRKPFALVAGLHRLTAIKRLGHSQIEAREIDEADAKMWEIVENLHRADLTTKERDGHLQMYAFLLKQQDKEDAKSQPPQVAAPEVGYKKPPPQKKGIARRVAEATGVSKDTVERALSPERREATRKAAAKRAAGNVTGGDDFQARLAERYRVVGADALGASRPKRSGADDALIVEFLASSVTPEDIMAVVEEGARRAAARLCIQRTRTVPAGHRLDEARAAYLAAVERTCKSGIAAKREHGTLSRAVQALIDRLPVAVTEEEKAYVERRKQKPAKSRRPQ